MKMNVGDKVRFLSDVGGGVVTKIIDKKMVVVLNNHGFEVFVQARELVVIEAVAIEEKTEELISEEINQEEEVVDADTTIKIDFDSKTFHSELNILLAIVPSDSMNQSYKIYLINDCEYSLLYSFAFRDDEKVHFIEANKLEDDTKVELYTIESEDYNKIKAFQIQAVAYVGKAHKYIPPLDIVIPFNPVKFYKGNVFVENDFFDENALIINIEKYAALKQNVETLDKNELEKIIREKESKINPQYKNIKVKQQKEFEKAIDEVDLHIHELVDNHKGMSNSEIIEIQLSNFQKKLNEAIVNRKRKIVFIHGVGNGILKVKLRNILDTTYKHLKYQDASFQKYGYGATMVFIR